MMIISGHLQYITMSDTVLQSETTIAKKEIVQLIKEGRAGSLDLRGVSLAGEDLSGADLSMADLSMANLTDVNLSGARLFKAKLHAAQLTRANLTGADLTGADLTAAGMEDVEAPQCGLGMACLHKTRLFNANLQGATLTKAEMEGTDLRCARMQNARLREANLSKADLTEADLREADLSLCNVNGAIFHNADMQRSRIRLIKDYEKAQWIGVDMRDINFAGAYQMRRFISDQNYLKEFRNSSRTSRILYHLWWITSDCGRSITRWCLWIIILAGLFAWIYSLVGVDYGDHPTFLSPLYYSVVTLTTLGYGDIVPTSAAGQITAMLEVMAGYIMLGGLLSIFSNKIARRAD